VYPKYFGYTTKLEGYPNQFGYTTLYEILNPAKRGEK